MTIAKKTLGAGLLIAMLGACGEAPSSSAGAARKALIAKHNRSCAICHNAGTANAPITFDVEAWQKVIAAAPRETLIDRVEKGYNAMPAGGLCANCSRDDFSALIDYMSSPRAR